MTSVERASKLQRYGAAHAELADALTRFPAEMWRYKPSDSNWSIHKRIFEVINICVSLSC